MAANAEVNSEKRTISSNFANKRRQFVHFYVGRLFILE